MSALRSDITRMSHDITRMFDIATEADITT